MGDGAGDRRRALVRAPRPQDAAGDPSGRRSAAVEKVQDAAAAAQDAGRRVSAAIRCFHHAVQRHHRLCRVHAVHLDDEPRHSDRGVQLQLAASGHRALEPKSIDRLCTRMRIV